MNEPLSRIVADLLVKANGGEDLSFEIHRLRDELKKVIESQDTIFGKLRELEESFREIIPEERQRYNAAIKALSTTSKLSRNEIIAAVTSQLEELKILEKVLMPAAQSDELKPMEAKLQEIRGEISKLREKTVQLENEEKALVNGLAARGKAAEQVEMGMKEVFTTIAAQILSIKSNAEEFTAERAPSPVIAQREPVERDIPKEIKESDVQKTETVVPSAPPNTEFQKKCPMCGGRMDLQINTWICYSCAYEELNKDEARVKSEEKSEHINPDVAAPRGDSVQSAISAVRQGDAGKKSETGEPAAVQNTEWQRKCPMCGGQMHFQISGEMWLCYSCAYDEKKDAVQSIGEENREEMSAQASNPISDASPNLAVPLESPASDEFQESQKRSSLSRNQPATKKKPCPACCKKMQWYPVDKAWRCPSCQYERRI